MCDATCSIITDFALVMPTQEFRDTDKNILWISSNINIFINAAFATSELKWTLEQVALYCNILHNALPCGINLDIKLNQAQA